MKILGEDHFEGEPRFAVLWTAGSTETPVKVYLQGKAYELLPNEETIVPESLKTLLDDSGFDVVTVGEATAVKDGEQDSGEGDETEPQKKSPKA